MSILNKYVMPKTLLKRLLFNNKARARQSTLWVTIFVHACCMHTYIRYICSFHFVFSLSSHSTIEFAPTYIASTYIYIYHRYACISDYICVYVCMCVCMYVCMYACMHVWMDGWMDGCMHACMHVCMYGCTDVWMYVWMDGGREGWMHVWIIDACI